MRAKPRPPNDQIACSNSPGYPISPPSGLLRSQAKQNRSGVNDIGTRAFERAAARSGETFKMNQQTPITAGFVVAWLLGWPVGALADPPAPSPTAARVRISDGAEVASSPAKSGQKNAKKKTKKLQTVQYESPAEGHSPSPQTAAPLPDRSAPEIGEEDDPLGFLLRANVAPIDLYSALSLAGEQNSQVLLAQQRVVEAVALRQLAAAQFLPTINYGGSSDAHWGVLQQSTGNILSVQRENVYVGAGANTVAAGTVNIPGVMWNLNVSQTIYDYLMSRQEIDRRAFESQATRQDVLLGVALGYTDLVEAEGSRSISILSRNDAKELARLTAAYVETGQGRKADADRAATELARREARVFEAEGQIVRSSAALCRLLHLDPTLRLAPSEVQIIPRSIVPDPIGLPELLAIGLMYRPELNERRAAAAQALLQLKGAKTLPFSPTLLVGFSAGGFGGGSNLVAQPTTSLPFGRNEPRFGSFADRADLDVMGYWTLQNLGVGNKSMIEAAKSRLRSADLQLLVTLDRVRSEVAGAQARTHARFARIRSTELAIAAATQAFEEDMTRIRGAEGLPLEPINSLRLLVRARQEYLDAILDYNKSQFELYVAVGKPPADLLMRPATRVNAPQGPDGP